MSLLSRILAFLDSKKAHIRTAEHAIVAIALYQWLRHLYKNLSLDSIINAVPGAAQLIKKEMMAEADKAVADLFPKSLAPTLTEIPEEGVPHEKILKLLNEFKALDGFKKTKGFGLIYTPEDSKHEHFTTKAYGTYIASNALDPTAFPSLRKLEVEVCSMTLSMLHAPKSGAATMTTGGTESILCAVKAYRDRARDLMPHIKKPEMLLPESAHVAFEKGAHYFGVKCVWVPLDEKTQEADLDAMVKLITKNTVVIVCSAPQYPAGVMDPIEKISEIAIQYKLPLHVDGCIGGFQLPWVERLGYPVPKWDFRVPGVTSISADCHKYGYAPKGASVLSWRTAEDRIYQFHSFAGWAGGYYASPSLLGTRAGGSIAAAWAALNAMGKKGYEEQARKCMEATEALKNQIEEIPELKLVGNPVMSIICFQSTDKKVHPFAIADVMQEKGWKLSRQQNPDSLHMTLMPVHAKVASKLCQDLKDSIAEVKAKPNLNMEGSAAMYGAIATKIPTEAKVAEFLKLLFSRMFQP